MTDRQFHPETLAIHAGQIPDAATGARALPIYQTSSFVFDSAEHAASLFNLQTFGNVYSRLSNPTVAVLEERVAALEGGRAGVASASGMAAETMALMTILQSGDHVVAAGALYGGSVTMLAVSLAKFGIETTFVDATKPEAFAAAMRPNTRAVYAESLGNPSMVVLDIAAVAEVAHAHGVPLIIDNTVPSPLLCNPLALGADIVVHSATKYLAGHGTTLGGVVVEGGKFPWDNGKFPGMTEPSKGYHGVKLWRLWLHHALPHGKPARVRRCAQPHERLANFARRRDPAPAHAKALRQRFGRGPIFTSRPACGLGQLPWLA
jgi:O-acetylhomoserine (thiol)-lyase